ncbi:hypothetical protein [Roseibacillus persicicus]|uniref:hypothetical protein n=1 Tax=Roseibacillus persicicus TaxID=454148 RepID=UPI00280CC050|nr:hypothetical protein [Roseibacillus persicicus]MDQ8189933.1 hypothetical protein [Roseibacillus persicicus]
MKFALPVLALGIYLLAFFIRQNHRHGIQLRNADLQAAIAKHEELHPSAPSSPQNSSRSKSGRTPSVLPAGTTGFLQLSDEDLRKLVQADSRGEMSDMRTSVVFRKLLLEAKEEELCELLDRAPTLPLSADDYESLVENVITRLGQLAPETALNRAFSQAHYDAILYSWHLNDIFSLWSSSEPKEAVAWLDARIADGSLQPKSLTANDQTRVQFESAAFFSLLQSDTQSARGRLLSLSPDLRLQTLSANTSSFLDLQKESEFTELATLIREALPEEQQYEVLNHMGGILAGIKLEGTETFLNAIASSQFEVAPIALAAINERIENSRWYEPLPLETELQSTREFIARYSPADQARVMGKTLAIRLEHEDSDLARTLSLLEKEYQQYPDDELIDSFLTHGADQLANRAESSDPAIQLLIAKIKDPTLRERWESDQQDDMP